MDEDEGASATPVTLELPVPPTAHRQGEIIRDGYKLIVDVLGEPLHELHCTAEISGPFFVIFDVFPFAAGGQRLAFKGSIYERVSGRGGEPVFRVHVVVKLEMAEGETGADDETRRTRRAAEEAGHTVRKHETARRFADKWGTLGVNKSVYVLSTERVRVGRGCGLGEISRARMPVLYELFGKLGLERVLYGGAVGTVEDVLEGRFTKFLNNDGTGNAAVAGNLAGAFAHWSWVESGGKEMVSDIQGVRDGDGYVLTDPCIHSVGDATGFGAGDLGMEGVEAFFRRHRCNALCRDLGLRAGGVDVDTGARMRTRVAGRVDGGDAEEAGEGKGADGAVAVATVVEAAAAVEESQGKVQRRPTLRVLPVAEAEEAEAEGAGRRRRWSERWVRGQGKRDKREKEDKEEKSGGLVMRLRAKWRGGSG